MTTSIGSRRLFAACALWGLLIQGVAAAKPTLEGDYSSARTTDDEFVQLTLAPKGKAVIIAENNFMIPGDASQRRGRTTTYAKWSRKGDIVTVTYSKLTDRLRFDGAVPLESIGQPGKAAALSPVKPVDAKSRLKGLTLWRAPHNYRLPQAEAAPAAPPPVK